MLVGVLALGGCARSHAPVPLASTRAGAGSDSTFGPDHAASTTVPVPGGCSSPRTTAYDAVGCYMAGSEAFGVAPSTPLYWHIDRFALREDAEATRASHGTVVQAHGRIWLFTLTDSTWRPSGGERVARIGPLPVVPGRRYAAHYLEGVVPAAGRTPVHQHAGPEAWLVLEGAQCLETPNGVSVVRAGESLIVGGGVPMLLVGVAPSIRRTLGLVLHDETRPWTIPAPDWSPKERCPR